MDCVYLIKTLKAKGIKFSEGLNEQEMFEIETLYDVQFPPDLKEFLMVGLPVSKPFVNWRDTSEKNRKQIKERLDWPLQGLLFDIENNGFWIDEWGTKPSSLQEAIERARREYEKAPQLIPIYSHRYIPAKPYEAGNPVFSVHQTDIIYYGVDLTTYFMVEFNLMQQQNLDFEQIKEIPFWSKLVE